MDKIRETAAAVLWVIGALFERAGLSAIGDWFAKQANTVDANFYPISRKE